MHGNPVNGTDPSGRFLSGFALGFAIGFAALTVSAVAIWHFQALEANEPGFLVAPWAWFFRPWETSTQGTWRAWGYLYTVLGRFPDPGEQSTVGRGCVGLLRVRLGLRGTGLTPWNEIDGTRAFIARDPNDSGVTFDAAYAQAMAAYKTFATDGDTDYPWMYEFSNRVEGIPVAGHSGGNLEVNKADIATAGVGDYNFASRLFLKDGNATWEWAVQGETSLWKTRFKRHQDLNLTRDKQIYILVSPRRNPNIVDVE